MIATTDLLRVLDLSNTGQWIIVTATIASMACSTVGIFLVLRRLSLVGDALSHSVLPGYAAAALLFATLDPFVMLGGALVAGVLTTWVTHLIRTYTRVPEDAALGVTFTSFFALGIAIIALSGQGFAIDPHIVLYGDLAVALIRTVDLFGSGWRVPEIVLHLLALLATNLVVVGLAWRRLKATAFDESFARVIGLRTGLWHALLMTLTAATIVLSFRAVGAILVVALIVVPAAAAYLLTDRLGRMLVISFGLGFVASVLGRYAAYWGETSVAGSIGAAHGAVLIIVFLVAPKYGLISQLWRHWRLSWRMIEEDILALLWRVQAERTDRSSLAAREIRAALGGGLAVSLALTRLRLRGQIRRALGEPTASTHPAAVESDAPIAEPTRPQERTPRVTETGLVLSPQAQEAARTLVRRHRVWESWLHAEFGVPPAEVHPSADRMMHVLPDDLTDELRHSLPPTDPHGKPIP